MSHVVSIKTEFRDIEAVKRACSELGLTFKENQKTIRWFGRWVNDYDAEDAAYKLGIDPKLYGTCDHAIEVPNCNYDIGLLKNPETGGYKLYFDFYGEGHKIQAALGNNGQKLLQYYAAHKLAMESKLKGYMVQRKSVGDKLELTITNV
ncbi:MAG: DUF1257 domain-containing protein [Patescibacteria group bacterium]|nr:DUF1257 domain-containing protein [Patescibacteria group bacterium]